MIDLIMMGYWNIVVYILGKRQFETKRFSFYVYAKRRALYHYVKWHHLERYYPDYYWK